MMDGIGYYVVRLPDPRSGSKLTIETRCFRVVLPEPDPELSPTRVRFSSYWNAVNWRDELRRQYPKDEVFIIEKLPDDYSPPRPEPSLP